MPASSRGVAPGYADTPPFTQLLTPTIAAFTTPSCGLSWNMPRKITPAASIEIAMGMKITSLNAVDHLMRSSSTANTRPRTVHVMGATITQMMLFRMAVNVESFVNIVT